MVNCILSSHAPIIGMPILRVNRDADLFYRHHPVMQGFGTRLRHARKQRKLNQTALAGTVKIAQSSLSDLETGATKEVSGPVLIALAAALRIRPEWLMLNRGSMELTPAELELKPDEVNLIHKYRSASPTWRTVVQRLAEVPTDQQDWLAEELLANVFQPAVPNGKVEQHLPKRPDRP